MITKHGTVFYKTIFSNRLEILNRKFSKNVLLVFFFFFEAMLKQKLDRLHSNLVIFPIFVIFFIVQELVMGIRNVGDIPGFLLIILVLKLKLIVILNVYFRPGKFSYSLAKLFTGKNENRYCLDISFFSSFIFRSIKRKLWLHVFSGLWQFMSFVPLFR